MDAVVKYALAMHQTSKEKNPANSKSVLVSIVIPTFNEEKAIEETVKCLAERFPSYELFVVYDGSTDATGAIVKCVGGYYGCKR